MFFDFDAIKQSVSLAQAAEMLSLQMKAHGAQMRGPCPRCAKGGDRALVITEGKGWYCFSAAKGGDVIALAAHIRDCSVKDAAKFLSKSTVPNTVPQKEDEGSSLQPLSYLEHDHAAVQAVGFDPDIAKSLGVGYAPKGIMRGTVAIPIRDESGKLIAYIGVEEARLPPSLMGNVVPLRKPA